MRRECSATQDVSYMWERGQRTKSGHTEAVALAEAEAGHICRAESACPGDMETDQLAMTERFAGQDDLSEGRLYQS